MREKLWKLWRGLPRLSRRGRTGVNLLISVLAVCLLWGAAGCPLPTAELEFRRLEREYLMTPSDIQGKFRTWGQREVIVGAQEGLAVLYDGTSLYLWPRQGAGAALIPVLENRAMPEEILFVGVDLPQGTHSARLEGRMSCWWSGGHGSGYHISAEENGTPWSRDYRAEGELLEDGGVLFRLTAREEDEYNDGFIEKSLFTRLTRWNTYQQSAGVRGVNARMEAVFYDESGAALGRAVLSTLEGGGDDAA